MEKKTTQRIIGILVVVALVVILMPLVFSKGDISAQTASIKAPPFPDQEVVQPLTPENAKVTAEITPEMANKINGGPIEASGATANKNIVVSQASTEPSNPLASDAEPVMPQQEASQQNSPAQMSQAQSSESAPMSAAQPDANKPSEQASAPSASLIKSSTPLRDDQLQPAASVTSAAANVPMQTADQKQIQQSNAERLPSSLISAAPAIEPATPSIDETAVKPAKARIHHPIRTAAAKHTHPHPHVSHATAVAHLKQPAWVIQMGSFKEKHNARRLADKLRTSGYKAFTREIKSARGGVQTRVYIGPEHKQLAAVKLSTKLEQNMNMRGFVVMYKPLEI
jgi:DedD protein